LGQSNSLLKIWHSSEIDKVLDTVDRASPKGKRDAAYIIIASELGMRSGDIRDLKLSDIDWDACTISFTQHKTGHPNTLPLNEKVGSAIIDYLYVRPKTDCEYLFVQLIPPYGQMATFNGAFQKYVHLSGVQVERDAHHGLHSLRATVATKLLSANVSPDTIFPFLGHSDRETLGSYVRYDLENLRECALSFEDGELI
jgi:integrase